jgi:hypothetical protein
MIKSFGGPTMGISRHDPDVGLIDFGDVIDGAGEPTGIAQSWIDLQARYDLETVRERHGAEIESAVRPRAA